MPSENPIVSCAIIRDLLPSYIDGLTSEETNAMMRAHLEGCPDCRAACEAMRQAGPEQAVPKAAPNTAMVRYLKKIKRKHLIRIVAVVALLVVCFSVITYFVAVREYPYPIDAIQVEDIYRLSNGSLYIRAYVDGALGTVSTFAFKATFTDSEGKPRYDAEHGGTQYEFQLGYRLRDLWAAKENFLTGAYFSFFVSAGDEGEGVYFRSWGGEERRLLWKPGDVVAPAPKEVEEMLDITFNYQEFGSGAFARELVNGAPRE